MFISHLLLAIAWSIFGILHSFLAGKNVKEFARRNTGKWFRYYRSFYNIVAFLLLAILLYWMVKMPSKPLWNTFFLQYIIGTLMAVPGILGIITILRKYFITSKGFRDLFYEGGTPVLVIDGFHRRVRHPLYFFTFLFLWGMLLIFPVWSLLVVNLVTTLYTLIGIRLEEKKLVAVFGEQYINYRKAVPMIWPRIW